jgi:protein O-mannosyl-transferase
MQKKKKSVQRNVVKKKELKQKRALSRQAYIGIFFILVLTFIVYNTILRNDLVNWDDSRYLDDNPLIRSVNLRVLFSTYVMGNYHPLTMLIYAMEYQIFGLDATGYHAVSLLLHLVNVVLVFYALFHLSNNTIVALVASLFFGIHPMHVESVAWASELKDLLYSLFFLGAYIFYLSYLSNQSKRAYYLSIILFLCSLLSKGMAAPLPIILLLTDYFKGRKIGGRALLEKIPFFLLALIFGIVAVFAQKSLGATESTVFPFGQRIIFASYAFVNYLIKLVVPLNLSSYYPYPIKVGQSMPPQYLLYPIVVVAVAVMAFYFRRFKKIIFGITFFTATIFLVLQLMPVGDAMMADRYTYIPSIGLFYLAGEGFDWLWSKRKKFVAVIATSAFAGLYCFQTYARCAVWENSLVLWNDVIDKHKTIPAAFYNRGLYFFNNGHDSDALNDFNKAIELKRNYADAYNNRGSVLMKFGKIDEALADLNNAISFNKNLTQAYFNRGYIFYQRKEYDQAVQDYDRVIELNPDVDKLAIVHNVMALLFTDEKKYGEALNHFNKAIELQPAFAEAFNNRGVVFIKQQEYTEAMRDFSSAITLKSNYSEAYFNKGIAESSLGDKSAACQDWQHAAALGYQRASEFYQNNCH